ncbi:MAG: polyketide synthase [Kiritimatiellae bacterium]|nr:polyketide synthase [Kiritimatiellia bacterium]
MSNHTHNDDLAIVGMACRFAGSDGLRSFWLRVLGGTSAIGAAPDVGAARFLDPGSTAFNRVSTLHGGYLRGLWQTNPVALGLSAANLAGSNPEHALALDLATQALKDAGYGDKALPRERTAAILGYAPYMDPATVNWLQQGLVVDQTLDLVRRCFPHGSTAQFETLRANLLRCLPEYDSRNLPGLLRHLIVGRIASRFDIQGPVYTVDAACASALVALRDAADELREGRADLALAGGIQGCLTPQWLMPYSRLGVLSGHDAPHPFGRDADGTLFGEGGAILVLKRRADAMRDGDRIYALLKSVGLATNGGFKDLLHTHGEGLSRAIQRACQQAGVMPDSVAAIEAHGSGIAAQDRAEVQALTAVFGARGSRGATVALGSVKALIGHCAAAAGAAGMVKAALGIYHRIIPPAQQANRPNPYLRLASTPFYLSATARPWVHNDAGQPRRAGVSAMAFGGVAAHALLEQFPGHK